MVYEAIKKFGIDISFDASSFPIKLRAALGEPRAHFPRFTKFVSAAAYGAEARTLHVSCLYIAAFLGKPARFDRDVEEGSKRVKYPRLLTRGTVMNRNKRRGLWG